MKIATRLKLAALVPAVMALVIGFALIFSYKMVKDAQVKDRSAQRIISGMNGLSGLVSEYVMYHDARPLQQFLEEQDSISRRIAALEIDEDPQNQLLNDIRRDMQLMKGSFLKLVANYELYRFAKGDVLTKEVENRLVGRLLVWTHHVSSQASDLERLVDQELTTIQRRISLFILAILVATTLIFGILLRRITRNITSSLTTLRQGVEAIGTGNLNHRIGMSTRDEIGDLSRSFDRMTEQLQTVTVSKNLLQQEIEERKKVEDGLRQSEERLRIIADFNYDWEYWRSPDNQFLYVSPSCERITGYSREEFINDPKLQTRIIHPEDRDRVLRHMTEDLSHLGSDEMEFRLICRDGTQRWIGHCCQPVLDKNGQTLGRRASNRDITARKEAEKALRRLSQFPEQNPNPVMRCTSEGTILFANGPARDWLASLGRQAGGPMPAPVVAALTGVREQERPVETEITNPGGRTFSIFAVQPFGEDYINLYSLDITERKQAQEILQRQHAELEIRIAERTEQLAAYAARLEWRNRELQEFSTVASHDLQEPLRKIQIFAEMLQEELPKELSDSAREYLSRMSGAATRMQELVKALLAYSRVSSKASPFERIDLKRIAEEVVEDLHIHPDQQTPVIEIDDLPAIDADPIQVAQLLQNLVGNAIRYSKEDQVPRIRIWAREISGNGNNDGKLLELRVEDNGIGFDLHYLDRIFQPFERLHERDRYEGTGMGLAICSKIVERHNGSITAESRPGEGSTFIVTLPMNQTGWRTQL